MQGSEVGKYKQRFRNNGPASSANRGCKGKVRGAEESEENIIPEEGFLDLKNNPE